MKGYFLRSVLVLGALFLWSCNENNSKRVAIDDFIPENASIVFKFSEGPDLQSHFATFRNDVKKNKMLSSLAKTQPYNTILKRASILNYLNPTSNSLLCLNIGKDSIADFTFISKASLKLFNIDSVKNKSIDTVVSKKSNIKRFKIDDQRVFISEKDSVFIASSSEELLKTILKSEKREHSDFQKLYNMNSRGDFKSLIKGNAFTISDSIELNFASWTSLDVSVLPDGILATGVATARDTIPQILSVFKGQIPQKNGIAKLIPTNALYAHSFTFSDADSLHNNLMQLRGETKNQDFLDVFGSIIEIGELKLASGTAVILNSIDPSITKESLLAFISENSSFREVVIHSFSQPNLFINAFTPLVKETQPNFSFQLEDFFVFTETEAIAEEMIAAFKNNNCLDKASFFEAHQSQLSSASSLVFYNLQGTIPFGISGFLDGDSKNHPSISLKNYPLAALQFSYDRDFAHVNFVCKETSSAKQTTGSVSEVYSLKLPNEIMGDPQFFTNHRTQGKDVVVQDITNTLYLISSNGKILWKRLLDGAILGRINEVDLLRNGKKQLAFSTQKTFYILDRTGKAVSPFPIKFKDPITQPLAVFDYDNNRKYRFVITQRNEIYMYDSKGKLVKGFTFKKTKSKIVLPPHHIRMGNKDYILIAEENGKLNILSRVGKSRVNVTKTFKFSEIPVEKEGSKFVLITTDNKKESISNSGKVSSRTLDVSGNYWFTIKGSTKVTLDDNLMRVNGKLVELPFGIYTQPEIFYANKSTYIAITETQENKIYIFDKSGTLLRGLPVFGSSKAEVVRSGSKGKLNVVVKGDANEVVLYRL